MLVISVHDVVDTDTVASPWSVQRRRLDRLVAELIRDGWSLVGLDDLATAPARSLAVTADDGRSGAMRWLQVAAGLFGMRATIFIVPAFVDQPGLVPEHERYSEFTTWAEITALQDLGHTIGSHGLTHRRLTLLSREEANAELVESRRQLQARLGTDIRHVAAPYGNVNDDVVELARNAGYVTLSTTRQGLNLQAERRSGVLNRYCIRSDEPDLGLADVLSRRHLQ
jgi:peptidoglycan/xylan/chitin deacetylase (PgdA/CDA1 family)